MRRNDDRHGRGGEDDDYARIALAPDLGNLEYLRAHYVSYSFAPHTHESFAIGVVERGVGAFALHGSMQIAQAGSVVAIDPEEAHTGGPQREYDLTYTMVYPSPSLLASISRQIGGHGCGVPHFPSPVI